MFSHRSNSTQLAVLHQILLEKKLDFQVKFPDIVDQFGKDMSLYDEHIQTYIETKTTYTPPIEEIAEIAEKEYGPKKRDKVLAVTQEEIDSVFIKIFELINSPLPLSRDDQLYLEQQLSDITGLTVSSEYEELSLPYNWGAAYSLPHTKMYPADVLQNHEAIHEALFQKKRSMTGWLSAVPDLHAADVKKETYSLVLPQLFWETGENTTFDHFKDKKALIVNPVSRKLAVAVTTVGYVPRKEKYSLGLSPELSRGLEVWRPPSAGKVFFLFIDDLENNIKPGIL